MTEQLHGGRAVTGALNALGVEHLFTLTGGHIFPILDGAHQDGIRIVDTRHEQSAAFAAEGWARLTRNLGVCAVTAGPGVTNALSPLAQASFNGAPVLCLAGRAPGFRWGQGSLQEIDHVPFVEPLAAARTVTATEDVAGDVFRAAIDALTPPRGPQFLDFPLEVLFNDVGGLDLTPPDAPQAMQPDATDVAVVAALLRDAERPVIVAGSNVWLDRAEGALRNLVESAEVPAFTNGQGRGCLPADHRLCFSRSRSRAFKESDLVVVAGTSMDFRLGFGQGFAPGAKIVHLESHPDLIATHVDLAASIGASLAVTFDAIAAEVSAPADTKAWVEALRAAEESKRDAAQADLHSSANPIHPLRVYGELVPLLDRDAVVICDGGDFASFAGREVPSYEPGCWLDTGPFGCLGVGPGYAMAARLAHPGRQVVVMYGDGAIGFSGMELETLVRLGLPVVCVVGNNGIWALEKYPMQALYGYDVAAELRPGIRYDKVMEAFGGRGFFVEDPDELGPALKAALDSGEPALVNVVTDASVAYPRSSNLA
ncbi:MAG TPA: acetolactate synthase [Actinomycetota bacterium]|nr:acetolactate synthase [Actinomycetota bacterium]